MQVQEIMSTQIESISSNSSVTEAAARMSQSNVGTLIVLDDNAMSGIITDRDICCRVVGESRDPSKTKVGEVMSPGLFYCYADQDLSDAAHVMEDKHVHRLAVLSRDDTMVGLLSIDDLAHGSHELAGEVLDISAVH